MHLEIIDSPDLAQRKKDVVDAFPVASVGQKGKQLLCVVDDDSLTEDEERGKQAVTLSDGRFCFLPESRDRVAQHIHIAGPSGCGKSSWAGEFARKFRDERGGRVVVVSADEEDDPAIPEGQACDLRLQLSEELGGVALEDVVEEEQPLLLIFDDVEGVAEPLQKALQTFRQAALERGRKYGVSTVNIFHRAAAGKATRDSLNEATAYVVFPRGGLTKNTRYALTEYGGQHPDMPNRLKRRHWGRTVVVTNTCPQLAIGERAAALLDPEHFRRR